MNDERSLAASGRPDAASSADLMAETRSLIYRARSASTLRAYQSAWAQFTAFCLARELTPLPAATETVAIYLTYLAAYRRLALSTIRRHVAVISLMHQGHGHPPVLLGYEPLRTVWRGIVREYGQPARRATPLRPHDLKQMVATCDDSLAGRRDRALILLGFATSFRRSEIVALTVSDIEEDSEDAGFYVTRGKSKTDALGGHMVWVPRGEHAETCPVQAYLDWIGAAGITEGPIFRGVTRYGTLRSGALSDRSVADIIARRAQAAGLTDAAWGGHQRRRYSGHSLRAGFITTARERGIPVDEIMEHTGHKSVQTLQVYVRRGSIRKRNVAGRLGL